MKKIAIIVSVVLALVAVYSFVSAQQIEDLGIAPTGEPYQYFYVAGSSGGTTWTLDSGGTGTAGYIDTAGPYRIVPGLYYTAKAKCADGADTVLSLQIWYNTAPTMTGAQKVDSFTANSIGGSAVVGGWKDFWGGAAGLKYPVTEGRFVYFVAANDTGAGANSNTFTLEVFSSVLP